MPQCVPPDLASPGRRRFLWLVASCPRPQASLQRQCSFSEQTNQCSCIKQMAACLVGGSTRLGEFHCDIPQRQHKSTSAGFSRQRTIPSLLVQDRTAQQLHPVADVQQSVCLLLCLRVIHPLPPPRGLKARTLQASRKMLRRRPSCLSLSQTGHPSQGIQVNLDAAVGMARTLHVAPHVRAAVVLS